MNKQPLLGIPAALAHFISQRSSARKPPGGARPALSVTFLIFLLQKSLPGLPGICRSLSCLPKAWACWKGGVSAAPAQLQSSREQTA